MLGFLPGAVLHDPLVREGPGQYQPGDDSRVFHPDLFPDGHIQIVHIPYRLLPGSDISYGPETDPNF